MNRTEQIKKLVKKGLSLRQIAKKENVTSSAIGYWVKKLGLKLKLSKLPNGNKPSKHNIVGKKFGFLKILKITHTNKSIRNGYRAICKCLNCGNNNFETSIQSIISRRTTSCGCRIDQYKKITGENSSQFTGYKEISGSCWKRLSDKRKLIKNPLKITIKQAYELFLKQKRKCKLTGLPIKFGRAEYRKETTASLDRIDSTKGYYLDNVQWVHKDVNIMKNVFNKDYFFYLCNLIAKKYPIDLRKRIQSNGSFNRKRLIIKETKMIKAFVGNIFDFINSEQLDTLMNAANGIGPMGKGIAGAIRQQGGREIQIDAFKVCKMNDPQPGDSYKTISGRLETKGIKRIIHAVTMKNPGEKSSFDIIEKAFDSSLKLAIKSGSIKIGCTALGTGIGGLDSVIVAQKMFQIANKYKKLIDIVFVDYDKNFINEIKKLNIN